MDPGGSMNSSPELRMWAIWICTHRSFLLESFLPLLKIYDTYIHVPSWS